MEIHALLKTLLFAGLLVVLLLFFRVILKRLVSQSSYPLWLAVFFFLLMSAQLLLSPEELVLTEDKLALSWVQSLQYILWWVALNYLVNQLISVFVWTKVHSEHGIMVSKILKDLTTLLLLVVTAAAIISFVFNKSIWGILTASSVVAIILGYSAQTTLSDIFAGLGLNTGKEFKEGDWIQVNEASRELTGKVIDLNWRVVRLQTKDNNYLTYPNSIISKLSIINLSQPETRHRIKLPFQTESTASPAHIKEILVNAARQCPQVLAYPAPRAEFLQIVNLEYHYRLTYFTNSIDEAAVNDAILSIAWYQLKRTPHKKLNMPQQTEAYALWSEKKSLISLLPKQSLKLFLKQCALFQDLTLKELEYLASNTLYHAYGPPERILEQGQSNTSLFIIYSGSVDVYVTDASGQSQYLATLGSGDYFGEMSLLTGELCSASVFAAEECFILEIDHNNMAGLFSQKPLLIKRISSIVVTRQQANLSLQVSRQTKKSKKEVPLLDRLVNSIKLFFQH